MRNGLRWFRWRHSFFGCSSLASAQPPAFAEFTLLIQTCFAQRACDARNWARWFVTFWFSLENLAHDWFLCAKLAPTGDRSSTST